MDVERRLIIMRRIAGAVGTAVLQLLKWMLKMIDPMIRGDMEVTIPFFIDCIAFVLINLRITGITFSLNFSFICYYPLLCFLL